MADDGKRPAYVLRWPIGRRSTPRHATRDPTTETSIGTQGSVLRPSMVTIDAEACRPWPSTLTSSLCGYARLLYQWLTSSLFGCANLLSMIESMVDKLNVCQSCPRLIRACTIGRSSRESDLSPRRGGLARFVRGGERSPVAYGVMLYL